MALQIETRTSIYTKRIDGIIVQQSKPTVRQSMEDARENVAAFAKLAKGTKMPLMVDLRQIGPTDPGVREYYAGEEAGKNCSAMALVIDSALSSMIGNFFINLNKPLFPCRLFSSISQAEAWLQEEMSIRKAS